MIELIVEPRMVKQWTDFVAEKPPYSIALDGYVWGRPRFERKEENGRILGPYANFNHHEEVDRLSTHATCGQVSIALKQGLLDTFRFNDEPHAYLHVNDPDQDTSLSVWLFRNYQRILGGRSEPLINRLVGAEDFLDVSAGAYPFDPQSDVMRELGWIFEPYTAVRSSGALYTMDAAQMRNVIDAVGHRISDYTLGKGQKITLKTDFELLGGGDGWALIKENGFAARTALSHQGIKAFVAVKPTPSGTYGYSIGRISPFIEFPLEVLYEKLNEAEGLQSNGPNCWGGGNTIGGSPRMTGSRLNPTELTDIINNVLSERRTHRVLVLPP